MINSASTTPSENFPSTSNGPMITEFNNVLNGSVGRERPDTTPYSSAVVSPKNGDGNISPPLPTESSPPSDEKPEPILQSFECELVITDQANQAYDNSANFEYNQALQIIQNAVFFNNIFWSNH